MNELYNRMDSDPVNIKAVCLKDLGLIAKNFAKKNTGEKITPITMARALAQMKNPYAEDHDVVLFLACKNGQCIGYHGLLPGMFLSGKQYHRVLWGSTFFLMDPYRGKGIGRKILDQVVSLQKDFVVTRITPQAYKSLIQYGMKNLGALHYYQLRVEKSHLLNRVFAFFRSREKLSGRRNPLLINLKKTENHVYNLEKKIFYRMVSVFAGNILKNYQVCKIRKVSASDFFLPPNSQRPIFFRGPEIINWMLQNKWVSSENHRKMKMPRYHFSRYRPLFSYIPLKIYSKNFHTYQGVLVLNISVSKDKMRLRLLDYALKDHDAMPAACAVVLAYAARFQADRVELPDKMGQYLIQHHFFKRFLKRQRREYLYFPGQSPSPLEQARGKILLDYCDGDTAFT